MELALLSKSGLYFLLKWSHFIFGIAWIGMLWYFNFVQGPFFAETDANTKTAATQKLVPRALWYFRWGAAFTVLSGLLLIGLKYHLNGGGIPFGEWLTTGWPVKIYPGILMGLIMAANVWFVIWPRQKKAIAAANGEKVENLPVLARRAFLASRTNTLFSIGLLFFMAAGSNLATNVNPAGSIGLYYLVISVLVALIEINALVATNGFTTKFIEKPVAVIHFGLLLAIIFYVILELLVK
ncbi:MAG: urate hydroxylase PuuD [Spirochaetia bacterium]|nr:urate hydroxylase PuuD [Spirochaetia bacterium]